MSDVDCIHLHGIDCGIGVYHRPSPGVCLLACTKRVKADGTLVPLTADGRPIFTGTIPGPSEVSLGTIQQYPQGSPVSVAVPRSEWPLVVRIVAKLAIESDTGIGDVVQRWAAMVGGEWIKEASEAMGKSCGCTDRQKWLNARYPLRVP
jgi:hypothetical protein